MRQISRDLFADMQRAKDISFMSAKGYSLRMMGNRLGISHEWVRQYMISHNIPIRSNSEAQKARNRLVRQAMNKMFAV